MTSPEREPELNASTPRETTALSVPSNAYFLELSLTDVRCFGGSQTLNLATSAGRPARWTLILGENGVGKTTLLQLLALAVAGEVRVDKDPYRVGFPRAAMPPGRILREYGRSETNGPELQYELAVGTTLAEQTLQRDTSVVSWARAGGHASAFFTLKESIVYGYGANRRRAPKGMTSETSTDPTRTLFDDDATLRNPEEWLLQNELVANTESPLRGEAQRQRERVKEILKRVLPGIDDLRVAPRQAANMQVRAVAEVHGPDGWLPFSALGLGYRTMTTWIVDLASRLFERYGALPDPLAGAAVCLIDEIDLHLHPRWQRDLIDHLTTLFPNTQFIATAHSPLIVQSARDANIVVLKREGDRVVIDEAPRAVRGWRLDQILTSELFDLPSARPKELDSLIQERDQILAKPALTPEDNVRLQQLRGEIGALPFGDNPDEIEAMDIIRRAASDLKNGK